MGVRHVNYVIEGVQYHPESIASEHGRHLIANFLSWVGGTWDALQVNKELVNTANIRPREIDMTKMKAPVYSTSKSGDKTKDSILHKIARKRKEEVKAASSLPGQSLLQLERNFALGLAPPLVDFYARLKNSKSVAVIAEIKRASPSKGDIDISAHAPSQALEYAKGGACAISVLTESNWFKGSLKDLRSARAALDTLDPSIPRPAILRKDFVIDKYQIAEARLAGADTILLIVALFDQDSELKSLLEYARYLGMEPLVEVANEQEMKRAVAIGSKIIGVNNRDLHTFNVDPNRTVSLAGLVPEEVVLLALSGIQGREDVEKYVKAGARGVLVGESLMRAADKKAFIRKLQGIEIDQIGPTRSEMKKISKVCGITNIEDALYAAKCGAKLIGLIFATSPRQVGIETAGMIVQAVKEKFGDSESPLSNLNALRYKESRSFTCSEWYQESAEALKEATNGRPLFVGVFSNASPDYMNYVAREVGLDLIQLHGDESSDFCSLLACPSIKALHVGADDEASIVKKIEAGKKKLSLILLDTGLKGVAQQGGSGVEFDWSIAKRIGSSMGIPLLIAGGITPESVSNAVSTIGSEFVLGLDVCSGVEASKGKKDANKLKQFIEYVSNV